MGLVLTLFDSELAYLPSRDLLSGHPELSDRKRAVLVDWMLELCAEYRFTRATFHLAVNLLDRFLSAVCW